MMILKHSLSYIRSGAAAATSKFHQNAPITLWICWLWSQVSVTSYAIAFLARHHVSENVDGSADVCAGMTCYTSDTLQSSPGDP